VSPGTATGTPRGRPVSPWGLGQGHHSFAGEGVGEADGFAVSDQERNAKLVVVTVLRVDATSAGIYSRPDVRLKGKRRPPIRSKVSSPDGRTVQ
jgi:hypothetical protein